MVLYRVKKSLQLLAMVLLGVCFVVPESLCMKFGEQLEEMKRKSLEELNLAEEKSEENKGKDELYPEQSEEKKESAEEEQNEGEETWSEKSSSVKEEAPGKTPLYNIKGTYNVVADHLKQLSLTAGAIAWETGLIRRLYHFGQLPRLNNQPHYRAQGGSATVRLIHALFEAAPNATPECDVLLSSKMKQWDNELQVMRNIAQIFMKIIEIRMSLSVKNMQGKNIQDYLQDEGIKKKFSTCVTALRNIVTDAESISLGENEDENADKETADYLMQSLLESNPNDPNALYLPYTTEMIFLAFAYKKWGHNKNELKKFYELLNNTGYLENTFLMLPRSRNIFARFATVGYEKIIQAMQTRNPELVKLISSLPKGWENDSYNPITAKRASEKLEELLRAGRPDLSLEDIVFYAQSLRDYPPFIPDQGVKLKINTLYGEQDTLVDASMDNAIRNLIRLLSYDAEQGKCTVKKLQDRGFEVDKKLEEFLENYSAPNQDDTPQAQRAWLDVTKDRDYIFYKFWDNEQKINKIHDFNYAYLQLPEKAFSEKIQLDKSLEVQDKIYQINDDGMVMTPSVRNMIVMLIELLGIKTRQTLSFSQEYVCASFATKFLPKVCDSLKCIGTFSISGDHEIGTVDADDFEQNKIITTRLFFKDQFQFVFQTNQDFCNSFVKDVASEKVECDPSQLDLKKIPPLSLVITQLLNSEAIDNIAFLDDAMLYSNLFTLPLEDERMTGQLINAIGNRGVMQHEKEILKLIGMLIKRHPEKERYVLSAHLASVMLKMKREGKEVAKETLKKRDQKILSRATKALQSGNETHQLLGLNVLTELVKHGKGLDEAAETVNRWLGQNEDMKSGMMREATLAAVQALVDKNEGARIDSKVLLILFMRGYDELGAKILKSCQGDQAALEPFITLAGEIMKEEKVENEKFAATQKILQIIVDQGDAKFIPIEIAYNWFIKNNKTLNDEILSIAYATLVNADKESINNVFDYILTLAPSSYGKELELNFSKVLVLRINNLNEKNKRLVWMQINKIISVYLGGSQEAGAQFVLDMANEVLKINGGAMIMPDVVQEIAQLLGGPACALAIYAQYFDAPAKDRKQLLESMAKNLDAMKPQDINLGSNGLIIETMRLALFQQLVKNGVGYQEAYGAAKAAYDNLQLREEAVAILIALAEQAELLVIEPEFATKLFNQTETRELAKGVFLVHSLNDKASIKKIPPNITKEIFKEPIKMPYAIKRANNYLEMGAGSYIPVARGQELYKSENNEELKALGLKIIAAHTDNSETAKNVSIQMLEEMWQNLELKPRALNVVEAYVGNKKAGQIPVTIGKELVNYNDVSRQVLGAQICTAHAKELVKGNDSTLIRLRQLYNKGLSSEVFLRSLYTTTEGKKVLRDVWQEFGQDQDQKVQEFSNTILTEWMK